MAYAARLADAIRYLYPAYSPRKDWLVEHNNGNVVITKWNIPAAQPTEQEVLDAIVAVDANKAAEDSRTTAFNNDTDRKDIVASVKNATPAQIKAYINNNVTDLASARAMLYRLTLLVAFTLRE